MRTTRLLVALALALPLAVGGITGAGCGSIDVANPDLDGGLGGGSLIDGEHPTGPGGGDSGSHDALPDFFDPGCPDAGPPPTDFVCDPYNQNNGDCGSGEGCYIFVQYPDPGEPCGQEVFGSVCSPVGPGEQGSSCGGAQDCGAGFVCVVSGSGNQCVQLCELTGEDGCPPGLVCEPIDVAGFGGCL